MSSGMVIGAVAFNCDPSDVDDEDREMSTCEFAPTV